MDMTSSTLMEYIEGAYKEIKKTQKSLPYRTAKEFIGSERDKEAASFIRAILQDEEFQTPEEGSKIYGLAETRARHSAITFLIGLVFLKYTDYEKVFAKSSFLPRREKTTHSDLEHLWMLTALYHDYGYFTDDVRNGGVELRSRVQYYLLQDFYYDKQLNALNSFSLHHKDAMAYTYGEIEAYDEYARHRNSELKQGEKIDHGILGGVRVFDKSIKNALKSELSRPENKLLEIKTSCLTIAQHNMYKSDSKEDDTKYGKKPKKLRYGSSFRIGASTPLLLLLGLVDTFECIKKLSRRENKNSFLQANTILNSIRLAFLPGEIVIDYTELDKRVREKKDSELVGAYETYKDNVLGLDRWTDFHTHGEENGTIRIEIPIVESQNIAASASENQNIEI